MVGLLRRCEQAGPRRLPAANVHGRPRAAGVRSSSHSSCEDAALPSPCCSRTAGCFGNGGELVHFSDVGSLKRLMAGVALGWTAAPGIGAAGREDHEGPRA
jgi:hypothetical protein